MIHLEAGFEKVAAASPFPSLDPLPLYHQVRTLEALRRHDLVVNTYDTGTGKTRASLLYLFDLDQANKQRKGRPKRNVLFIAPTNALLAQHQEDIKDFVQDNDLDFRVLRVTAPDISDLDSGLRAGETLQRFIQNPLEFDPHAIRNKPIIVVVNPDIYYYAMYFRYGAHDRRNVFAQFLERFSYIVIDEFHYYDSKQLANFLFFFALFDVYGYFGTEGNKICLLSATPAEKVQKYLARLFGAEGERWAIVSKENEAPESATLDTIPTLAPLDLTILNDELQSWVSAHLDDLQRWVLEEGLDGAVISSALWRVNAAYGVLRAVFSETRMGRITGPEKAEKRLAATGRDLILASPTVDIGYNFKKLGKARQNVDFLVCDARFSDGLRQRIGRAGRVLGKEITDRPSFAIALLSDDAAAAFTEYDGQTMSRAAFKAIVKSLEPKRVLPEKHSLYAYIRSHAITESFWPIYQLGAMTSDDDRATLDQLYTRVLEVFAPNSRRSKKGLEGRFRAHVHREEWLAAAKKNPRTPPPYTAQRIADWSAWLFPEDGFPEAAGLKEAVNTVWGRRSQRDELIAFVEGQVALTRALFSFRDSFQGPKAAVYDPKHMHSSEDVSQYDLFHLLSNYHLDVLDKAAFRNVTGVDLKANFYVRLKSRREGKDKQSVTFVYDVPMERDEFEGRFCCGEVVALSGLRLVMKEYGGNRVQTATDVSRALEDQHIPILLTTEMDRGMVISKLRGTNLWGQLLVVNFADGREREYRAFMGTAAFHAQAELYFYFKARERMKALQQADAFIV